MMRWPACERLRSLAAPFVTLLTWEFLVRLRVLDARFFPAPSQVGVAFWALVRTGQLQEHVTISLWRILWGFLLGSLPSIAIGLLIGMSRRLRALLNPQVSALYALLVRRARGWP